MSSTTTLSAQPASPAAAPPDVDSTGGELVLIRGMHDDSRLASTLAGQVAFCRFTLGTPARTSGPGTVRVSC